MSELNDVLSDTDVFERLLSDSIRVADRIVEIVRHLRDGAGSPEQQRQLTKQLSAYVLADNKKVVVNRREALFRRLRFAASYVALRDRILPQLILDLDSLCESNSDFGDWSNEAIAGFVVANSGIFADDSDEPDDIYINMSAFAWKNVKHDGGLRDISEATYWPFPSPTGKLRACLISELAAELHRIEVAGAREWKLKYSDIALRILADATGQKWTEIRDMITETNKTDRGSLLGIIGSPNRSRFYA